MEEFYLRKLYHEYAKTKGQSSDNYSLSKPFEIYTCLMLSKNDKQFYLYEDVMPDFKEINKLTVNDTGIDLIEPNSRELVQCKLRKNNLTWSDLSTFIASAVSRDGLKLIVEWNLILARNDDSTLSRGAIFKSDLFTDITYNKEKFVDYCDKLELIESVVKKDPRIVLRDYQLECIDLIKKSGNIVINLPTGLGKGEIVMHSMEPGLKYLILVPRNILAYQYYNSLEKIGLDNMTFQIVNSSNEYSKGINITICVYNSIDKLKAFKHYSKVYLDECHHCDPEQVIEDTYMSKIASLSKYNNNVYLSATAREVDGFVYYSKDIREAINLGYICDYRINIPVFTDKPSNNKVCDYLLENYRSIIIYCETRNECKQINSYLNSKCNDCSDYIDCDTPPEKRMEIFDKFENDKLMFIVNVETMIEGVNLIKTNGVCMFNLTKSAIRAIQIIGRALRLHPLKLCANVILPALGDVDCQAVNSFIRKIAKHDSRIKQSYNNRITGGYINIDCVNEAENDAEFIYTRSYEKEGGNPIVNSDKWDLCFELSDKIMSETGKRPKTDVFYDLTNPDNKPIELSSPDRTLSHVDLGRWVSRNLSDYMENKMKPELIEKFKLFMDKHEKLLLDPFGKFLNNIRLASDHMDKYGSKLTHKDNTKVAKFIEGRLSEFRNEKNAVWTDPERNRIFSEFITKYAKYLLNKDEIFTNILTEAQKYIDSNKCKLGKSFSQWGSYNKFQSRYENTEAGFKNPERREEYETFMTKNKKYYPDFKTVEPKKD